MGGFDLFALRSGAIIRGQAGRQGTACRKMARSQTQCSGGREGSGGASEGGVSLVERDTSMVGHR